MFSLVSQLLFGSSNFFGSSGQAPTIKTSSWKDKSLCFDLRTHDLELDGGEQLIGSFFPIEDFKGNQDEFGLLKITNLRLIWVCCKKKRINLSIGWRTVLLAYENNLKDALGAPTTSLFILTKYESTKYEFVFNRPSSNNDIWTSNQDNWQALTLLKKLYQEKPSLISHLSPMYLDDPFEIVFKVWQAYKQTHSFRHCRVNSANLLQHRDSSEQFNLQDINKLPSEEIMEMFSNVIQSESRSVKYNGNLILTNVRLIWIDELTSTKNLSIPYIRVESLKLKQSNKIVVSTQDFLANSTHVDFRVHKSGGETQTIKDLFKQMQNLLALFKAKPRFGPESCDEILNFMSNLKPTEYYLNSVDQSFGPRVLDNLGPQRILDELQQGSSIMVSDGAPHQQNNKSDAINDEDEFDRTENDLHKQGSNLRRYLNEQPIERDSELVYSAELGLAIEKPIKGTDIARIWQMDL